MTFTEEQKQEHERVMLAICHSLHKNKQPMVLKGGTALRFCYGLDRFSEDLDFDSAKPLNLERTISKIFSHLGKNCKSLRNIKITLTKKTDTVRRYRVEYGDDINLKIETSLRGTPDDSDLAVVNGIITYKVSVLIAQKLSALRGRTTARDLHDVIYLYENYYDDFTDEQRATVIDLYNSQSEVLARFNAAYLEDTILDTEDLLSDLMKLIELVDSRVA